MSMHLLPAQFNTNDVRKKKLSVKQQRVKDKHEAWLKKRGLHSSQIAERRKTQKAIKEFETSSYIERKEVPKTSDKVGNGFVKSIFEGLDKEPEHVKKEIIRKAQRVGPLWSKGGTQYITDDTILSEVGRKI